MAQRRIIMRAEKHCNDQLIDAISALGILVGINCRFRHGVEVLLLLRFFCLTIGSYRGALYFLNIFCVRLSGKLTSNKDRTLKLDLEGGI